MRRHKIHILIRSLTLIQAKTDQENIKFTHLYIHIYICVSVYHKPLFYICTVMFCPNLKLEYN